MSSRTANFARRGRTALGTLATLTSLALLTTTLLAAPALAENSGYWYGADSGGPGPTSSSGPPFDMPSCGSGHIYGGYIGKIGGADLVSSGNPDGYGPGNTFAWNSTDAADANANHFSSPAEGVGTGGFWFMFGPGDTDGTGLSAYNWGHQQGEWALADWQRWYNGGSQQSHRMPLRILWMDVEGPGANGWGSDGSANRQVFNGFWDYVTNASEGISAGVYSTEDQWDSIMSGSTGIASTWEWTAQVSRANSPSPCPDNFSESSSFNAVFFGGQDESSAMTAMWQWSLGNADYDQIDSNKALPD
jgi:hypothetical protein